MSTSDQWEANTESLAKHFSQNNKIARRVSSLYERSDEKDEP